MGGQGELHLRSPGFSGGCESGSHLQTESKRVAHGGKLSVFRPVLPSRASFPCFLPVLPPRASPLLLTAHFTSGASGHQMRGGFHLYQAILCATSRASCNLTQFRCHLSGGSARSRRRRAQSHETAPHFRCQLQAVGPQVTHSFRPTWSQIGVPTTLFSG